METGKRKRVCILENDRGRGRDPGNRVRTLVDGDRERNEARQDVRGTIIVGELSCLSSSSSSSAFPLRLNGRTSAKPERKGAKEGEARTISNVNTYLIVAFPSKPRSFLPRDDSRDRSREGEGEGGGETKGRKDGKGKIGGGRGREKENERERERDTRVYEIYIRGEKFRNDRITLTFSSFLFFSPVVRESEALHLLEESKIVGPRVFSPRLSLFIIDAVVDIVSSVSSK